ncbi:MAG: GNAT family N-acyltransferase [Pseudomonadota bacterium]
MTPALRSLPKPGPALDVRIATREADLLGAQRLRYEVFVSELGGDGALVDHINRFERDAFDPVCDHLILVDPLRDEAGLEHVVGVYRLLPDERAGQMGYYSAGEFDLGVLERSGRKLLELGRSCLHPDVRGGSGLYCLWTGLAAYIEAQGVEILFGVASFHGTDIAALTHPLAFLHHNHLAPPELRITARPPQARSMDLLRPEAIDRRAAARAIPALLKSYLRMGGFVGEGAWIDAPFNTTDVGLVMDVARVDARTRSLYAAGEVSGGR